MLGCSGPSPALHEHQLFAFGTLIELTFYGTSDQQAREAAQQVDAMYQRQHQDWHAWRRGHLQNLNEAIAENRAIRTDPSILELIQLGQHLERISHGLFNPAIGNLLNIWGFQKDETAQGPPPSAQSIQRCLSSSPSTLDLQLEGQVVHSANPAVRLDFGGFAKGYSVGAAVQLIKKQGINNFIVNAGGDLCVRGKHGQRPWRIGIRDPRDGGVLASIELTGAACAFTSGDDQRYFEFGAKRYHHILDPGTGYPAQRTRSVTVVDADPVLADAAATALFVAGPARWKKIARSMGVDEVLLLDDADVAYVTPDLARQLSYLQKPAKVTVVPLSNTP
jgi:thiamine biosynthesis lipoprotein